MALLEGKKTDDERQLELTAEDINYSIQKGCAVICATSKDALELARRLIKAADDHPDLKGLELAAWPDDELPKLTNWCVDLKSDWARIIGPEQLVELMRRHNKIEGCFKMTRADQRADGGAFVYMATGEEATSRILAEHQSLKIPMHRVQFMMHTTSIKQLEEQTKTDMDLAEKATNVSLDAGNSAAGSAHFT